ncbi:MAG TPA: acyloxyacyl hydrolase [Caulobacterales bacterium]|nr:acyloxyacyl hydrolase [Caulobacterales bacterium]
MRGKAAGIAALGAAMMGAPAAYAEIENVHVGVMQHNVCITNCKNADKEDGPNIELQADFSSPHILHWMLAPRPYVMASINVAGDTSFVAAGLDWRFDLSDHWAIEPGLGYAIHNGEVRNPYPNGDPRATQFSEDHILFGSRDLFRTSLGVTYSTDGPWEIQGFYSHLSHGQILGTGRNQGVDQLGLRVGYRFR